MVWLRNKVEYFRPNVLNGLQWVKKFINLLSDFGKKSIYNNEFNDTRVDRTTTKWHNRHRIVFGLVLISNYKSGSEKTKIGT